MTDVLKIETCGTYEEGRKKVVELAESYFGVSLNDHPDAFTVHHERAEIESLHTASSLLHGRTHTHWTVKRASPESGLCGDIIS